MNMEVAVVRPVDTGIKSWMQWIVGVVTVMVAALTIAACIIYQQRLGYSADINYQQRFGRSVNLPQKPDRFVGREEEILKVMNLLNFHTSDSQYVKIVGGPGFGKSALAVSVGHELVSRGVDVYYVDIKQGVSSIQALAEKIMEEDVVTVNKSAMQLQNSTLLIIDHGWIPDEYVWNRHNCGGKEEVEKIWKVVNKLNNSEHFRILSTSREYLCLRDHSSKKVFKLRELSTVASCSFLKLYSENLTDVQCETLANLTGNVPFALRVVGYLLVRPNHQDPDTIINNLRKALIPTLNPKELPVEKHVSVCIGESFYDMNEEMKGIAQHLANFPGPFSLETAVGVMHMFNRREIEKALGRLIEQSLLRIYPHARNSFQFNQIISEFIRQTNMPASIYDNFIDFESFYTSNLSMDIAKTHPVSAQVNMPASIEEKFIVGFVSFFTHWSRHIIQIHPELAQVFVDQERHNLLYYLRLLGLSKPVEHSIKFLGIKVVSHLYLSGHLQHHFTISELQGPTEGMVNYLKVNCNITSVKDYGVDCVTTYELLVLQLATFEERNEISRAFHLLDIHFDNMEELVSQVTCPLDLHTGIKFFCRLEKYLEHLGFDELTDTCQVILSNLRKGNCELYDGI